MILVVGATGRLGRVIVQRLRDEGKDVRMLVRAGSQYDDLQAAGAQPVQGDLKDRASLDAAVEGVEAVITTANSSARGGEDTVESVDERGNQNLIEAAGAAYVKQFVFVSALGADTNHPAPFFQAKARTEAFLRTSGLTYTILAPSLFMDVWLPTVVGNAVAAGGPVTLVGEGRRRINFIAADDVAAFATRVVGHLSALNQYIPIGGPESLSWRDIVGIYERVLGRSIEIQTVAPGSPVPGLPEFTTNMMADLEQYDMIVDMEETARAYDVTLTSAEQFIRGHVA